MRYFNIHQGGDVSCSNMHPSFGINSPSPRVYVYAYIGLSINSNTWRKLLAATRLSLIAYNTTCHFMNDAAWRCLKSK